MAKRTSTFEVITPDAMQEFFGITQTRTNITSPCSHQPRCSFFSSPLRWVGLL